MARVPRDPCAGVIDDASHWRTSPLRDSVVQKVLRRDLVLHHSYPQYPAQPNLVEWDVTGSSTLRATEKDGETETQREASEAALKTLSK